MYIPNICSNVYSSRSNTYPHTIACVTGSGLYRNCEAYTERVVRARCIMTNSIKKYIWTLLPVKYIRWFRDKKFNKTTRFHKLIRKAFLPREFRPGHDCFNFPMDAHLAMYIRYLRKTHSWRALATRISEENPKFNVEPGCQMDGKWLCEYASACLGEEIE